MAYKINDDCINCGACEPECPVSCITEGDTIYVIDEEVCTDCGACVDESLYQTHYTVVLCVSYS